MIRVARLVAGCIMTNDTAVTAASNAAMINGHHYEYILIHHLRRLMHLAECIIYSDPIISA